MNEFNEKDVQSDQPENMPEVGNSSNRYPPQYPPYSQSQQNPQNHQYSQSYQYGQNYQYGQHGNGNGWQQSPGGMGNRNAGKGQYQWQFEDYTKPGFVRPRKRSRAIEILAFIFICFFAVVLMAMSGFALYQHLSGSSILELYPEDAPQYAGEDQTYDGEAEGAEFGGENNATIEIVGRPQSSQPQSDDGPLTTAQVAERVTPAVVGVTTYVSYPFFRPIGSGSGVIMSEDGFIITNAHVVENADAIRVILYDDTHYEAVLVGTDARTDLAVIKIEAEDLPAAIFGDSDELRVGETVLAIGNPAGMLSGTVTRGIVSALDRRIEEVRRHAIPFIQTDAAINPGNSGGALVNEYGQVIGIPSAKIVAPEYEGIGFAIPITDAKPIINDLLANGRVTGRVILGITVNPIDEIISRNANIPMGVQIRDMAPGSHISTSGVRSGDIITHINGERIYTTEDIWEILDQHSVGDTVRLTVFRQPNLITRSTLEFNVVLQEDQG